MLTIFSNDELEYIYVHGKEKGKPSYPSSIVKAFIKKVDILASVSNSHELTQFQSLHFEALKDDLKGFYSIRVNKQYRIVFKITKEDDSGTSIEIVDIHYLTDYHRIDCQDLTKFG